jgi:hypothetical protein
MFPGDPAMHSFMAMWMTRDRGHTWHVSIHTPKYRFATLIQSVALAPGCHFSEHASHCSYPLHQTVEFRELFLGQRPPTLRRPSGIAETKEQMSDLTQCKTELTCTLNDCQPVKHRRVVASLPAHSRGRGKQSNSLVVTNRRCLKSNLSRHFRNRQFGHRNCTDHRFPIIIRMLTDCLQKTSCLKADFNL